MTRTIRVLAGLAVATTCLVSCTIKKQEATPLSGPSELATALSISANPDTLRQDGSSQSQIVVAALDSTGRPVRNLPVRLDILVGGRIMDFGEISAKNVVTSVDGQATVIYTSPYPSADPASIGLVVQIQATPTGSDYGNATTRFVSIRLVPPGVILPPNGTPSANFVFLPDDPLSNDDVTFNATSSTDDGQIVSYAWNFGDGATGSGAIVSHKYDQGGSYVVTLTVTDDRGLSASKMTTVTVTESTAPTAAFTTSPSVVYPGDEVFFNAGASTSPFGLTSWEWDFGDGTPQHTGETTSHVYTRAGAYTVALTVQDAMGRTATLSKSVTVTSTTANFTYAPIRPVVGEDITFDGSSSIGTIKRQEWVFGDTRTVFTVTVAPWEYPKHYHAAGTYLVTLTVIDDEGLVSRISKSVIVR